MLTRRLRIALLAGMICMMAGGCGNNQSNKMGINQYDEDGYMGITEANPNMPTSPTYRSYARDVAMATRAVNQMKGVRTAVVWVNGATMHVRIQPDSNRQGMSREALRQHAFEKLDHMVPKYYQIKVYVTQ